MSAPHADQIIDGYLSRLRDALADLPRPRQQELVSDVKGHIAEARVALRDETDADVLTILDRIGEPADIAAEARERLGVQPRQPPRIGLLEIGALVLTPFLWPVGIILLWTSSAWNTRDKLIGTLVPPGGYLGLGVLAFLALLAVRTSSVVCTNGFCPASPSAPAWVGLPVTLVVVAYLVLPLLTAVYLGFRLRRAIARPTVPA